MGGDGNKENFRLLDFIIFFGLFFISAIVGAVFAYRDRNKQSVENYYFGGRKISAIPVAVSIAVSVISAITVIGVPAEVYLYGDVFSWFPISLSCPVVIGALYIIPVYHRLRVSSTYEYLELRFHRNVRTMVSVLEIFSMISYLSVAVFLPSLALSAVTPLNLTWTIALTSMTCTLYTTLGGMKAVIWTDVLQSFVMLCGMAVVFIQTAITVGGLDSVYSAAKRGGRDNLLTFDFDPRVRGSAVTILIGGAVNLCHGILCNQIYVQRWLSCKTINSARLALILSVIPLSFFYMFSIGNGLTMYAYYEGCDPLLSDQITKPDQLIPRLAVDIFYGTPGLAGLFVSAAFCGTLSTVSSGLNALSALGLMDLTQKCFPNMTSRTRLVISKAYTIVFGAVVMLIAYTISLTSTNAVEIGNMFAGFFAGPLVGLYFMGMAMPWINHKGALTGFFCGFAFVAWIGIASKTSSFVPESSKRLPLSDDNCTFVPVTLNFTPPYTSTFTTEMDPTSGPTLPTEAEEHSGLETTLYAISTYLYGVMGMLMSIFAAHIASIFLGFSKPSEADPRLFVPLVDNRLLPLRVRKFFRFGVPEISDSDSLTINYTNGTGEIKNSKL